MTTEDKRLISEYMGWFAHPQGFWYDPPVYFTDSFRGKIKFDLNDAGLCAKKMKQNGDWDYFLDYIETCTNKQSQEWSRQLIAWLYDSDNFFTTMAAWLKEEENG